MKYSKAPVVEAVIDVQVEFDAPPDQGALELFGQQFAEVLPISQQLQRLQVQFGPEVPGGHQSAKHLRGVRRATQTNSRVLNLSQTGLSWIHLPEYSNWETFYGEFETYWDSFVRHFNPKCVTRLATRYINSIEVPQGADLAEFINVLPTFPDELSNTVSGYGLQIVVPQPLISPSCTAVINSGLGAGSDPSRMSILLDIDVFVTERLNVVGEDVPKFLGELRLAKNRIFDLCITDTTKGVIQ